MGDLKAFLKKVKLNESTISTLLGVIVVLVVGVLVINYFRNIKKIEKISPKETAEKEEERGVKSTTDYIVEKGDTLWAIAEKIYGSGYNWIDIAKENDLSNPNHIEPGQKLILPPKEAIEITSPEAKTPLPITEDTYTVVKGDHLWGIAVRAYGDGFQWVKIARENRLANPDLIHSGNVLKIPR